MYLFIAIIFIAELIIAGTVINFIVKLDKKVQYYSCCVEAFNPLLETCLQYSRCLVANFKNSLESVIVFVKKKREQIVYKTVAVVGIYLILILFRIKKIKAEKIYRLAGVVKDIVLEFAV